MREFFYSMWQIVEIVIIAAATVFLIRAFIVQPFLVSGSSMFSTYIDGDYVLVDELTYKFKEPSRGDVVVFRYPLKPSVFYIKRVMGLPGDHVVVKSGQVYINDKQVEESYLDKGITSNGDLDIVVKPGELYAFGDNRPHSYDSRFFGPIPFDNLIGLVNLRLLPVERAEIMRRPIYN